MTFQKWFPVAVVILGCFLLWPVAPQLVTWVLSLVLIVLLINSWDSLLPMITT